MKQLKDFAVKVIGMTDEEAAALYDADENIKEGAFDLLASKDKERLKHIKESHKEELTNKFNEGHAKAKKEERGRFEAEIKEYFGLDTNSQGLDLIKDATALAQKDDIKTHPDYIALEKKLQSDYIPKDDYEVIRGEYDEFKQKVQRDSILSKVRSDADSIFQSLHPQLPKDPKRAKNQKDLFFKQLEQFDYQVAEDGNHIILKDGKRLENDNMNPVLFGDFVKQKTLEFFDVDEQSTKGNSGVDPAGRTSSASYKDKGEFYNAYAKETDREKRVAMWEAAKKQGLV